MGSSASWLNKHRFGGNRELAILRDGERCVRCGMGREEHKAKFKKDITVDHIIGHGIWDMKSEEPNNHLSNLQTLCQPCHTKKDSFKIPRTRKKMCLRGHDTSFPGSRGPSGGCVECNKVSFRKSRDKYRVTYNMWRRERRKIAKERGEVYG